MSILVSRNLRNFERSQDGIVDSPCVYAWTVCYILLQGFLRTSTWRCKAYSSTPLAFNNIASLELGCECNDQQ